MSPYAKHLDTPNKRTRYRIECAVRRRVALIVLIGTPGPEGSVLCAFCGRAFHPSHLEVDHVDGITWNRYELSPQMRVAKYWREHKAGVRLRAGCQSCNARDGARRRWNRTGR